MGSSLPLSTPEPTRQAFRFFDLPPEIRYKILSTVYQTHKIIDVDDIILRRLISFPKTFLVSKKFHEEATTVFYSINTFRLFPIHGNGFPRKFKPVVSHFPSKHRAVLRTLELRFGPLWTEMPKLGKIWKVKDALGLEDMISLRKLRLFVEIDPSCEIFNGFRSGKGVQVGPDFFTNFAGDLLEEVIARLPVLEEITFETYPAVERDSPLISRLVVETIKGGLRISWSEAVERRTVRMTEWFTV